MPAQIELGGGNCPILETNLDCRRNPKVSIIADLESPLPLRTEAFDLVYSAFAMEHLSWRRVEQFIAEVYRILKPAGKAVIITSDLRAQFRYICKKERWTLAEMETIFGSQDYSQNCHRSSMSMELAQQLFETAGFNKVTVSQVGCCGTDMQITAEKTEDISNLYEREYFEEGTTGYKMYRDFPAHWRMVKIIMDLKPESVLELGGARGYITKKLEGLGVRAVCMDKSLYCWHTRATNSFVLHDALDVPYPFKDKEFDLCYAASFMEHFKEEDLPKLIGEMARVCKRGYFTITFEKTAADIDVTHKCFPQGTRITMANGQTKAIENIKIGEAIIGCSIRGLTTAIVTHCFEHTATELVRVTFDDGTITMTPDHPVLTTHGWVNGAMLKKGDTVYSINEANYIKSTTTQLLDGELQEEILQGVSARAGRTLELVTPLGTEETGLATWERELLVRRRGKNIERQLRTLAKISDIDSSSKSSLEWNPAQSKETTPETLAINRIPKSIATTQSLRNRSSIHSRIDRRGRVSILHRNITTQPRMRTNAVQHRPKNDTVCEGKMRRNALHKKSGIQYPILCSQLAWLPSFKDDSDNGTIPRDKSESSRIGGKIPDFEVVKGEKCSHNNRGKTAIIRMAKVVSTERLRGVEGKVFNLSTTTENYFAEGILVHNCFKPLEWWQAKFKEIAPDFEAKIMTPQEAYDLERVGFPPIPPADGLVKLNIGCFTDMYYYGWKNIDAIDLTEWAKLRGYEFIHADVTKGILMPNDSVDLILASHFLEHLTREEGAKFLAECHRVLKPEGIIRLAVPDARFIASSYLEGRIMEFRYVNVGVERAADDAEAFHELLMAGHKTIYDKASLRFLLSGKYEKRDMKKLTVELADMWDVKVMKPFESTSKVMEVQTISMFPTLSLYMEARKVPQVSRKRASEVELSATHVGETDAMICKDMGSHYTTSGVATTHVKSSSLKVALLSTPLLQVPPVQYGGLELIVANLGKELAKLEHDVTIFAPSGSKVEGCRMFDVGEAKNTVFIDWLRAENDMFELVKAELMTGGYDIIHGHNWFGMEYRAKALDGRLHVLHTHHGGLLADWWTKTRAPFKLNMCGISNWMKSIYEGQGIPTRAVYNGVDLENYPLKKQKGDRYLWLSRIAFFKSPHKAIELAKELGLKLDVAGATMFVEDAKYVDEIRKSCDGDQIRFIGEVSHAQKLELLQNAKALLVTAKWGEPFGLHVIEAMATGTPVVAIADGGIKETVKFGGILCDDLYTMKDVLTQGFNILPSVCRKNAELFSARNMALAYEKAYKDILAGADW